MLVLYICYVNFSLIDNGSYLRPYKIYHAMLDMNYNVKLIYEDQTLKNKSNRINAVNDVISWLDENKPDFCYIESATTSIRFNCDYRLINKIHQMRIPSAFFYRDFYYKFNNLGEKFGFIDGLKNIYIEMLWHKTNHYLKKLDIIYFPSIESTKHFNFSDMRALPPAGDVLENIKKTNSKNCIYVGGLSKRYGTNILLEAFSILNEKKEEYKLTLICREDEFKEYSEYCKNITWLNVQHVHGNDLKEFYYKNNVALLPLENTDYNDLAVSVKLFEYMSYGMVIVSTCNTSMSNIISECNCGIICKDNAQDFAKAVRDIFKDNNKLKEFSYNSIKAIKLKHNWQSRVMQISEELKQIGDQNDK